MDAVLKSLEVHDAREDGGTVAVVARFEDGKQFLRNVEQPFSLDGVGKALYLLATDLMRAAHESCLQDEGQRLTA